MTETVPNASQPPVYEVRAMSLAEILDTSFQLVKNGFVLLGGLSSIVYLPLAIFVGALTVGVDVETMDEAQLEAALPMFLAMGGLYLLVVLVGFPFVVGAVTGVAGRMVLGQEITFGEAVRLGLSRFLSLLWAYFLFFFLIGVAVTAVGGLGYALGAVLSPMIGAGFGFFALLGVLAATVLYLYAFPGTVLLPQVVVLEEETGMDAVRRSWDLCHGVRWRMIGVLFTAGFLVFIPISGLQMMVNVVPVVGTVVWGIAQAVGFAFTSAAQVVLYFDIRCRKEAFDLEHLAQLVEGQEAPPVGAP